MLSSAVQLKIVHFYSPPIKKTCLISRFSEWSRPLVPNLWYAYPWGYVKIILVMAENTKRKRSKLKIQKQSHEVLVYRGRLM
jgi:hypothetical protein